jgi:hypothetical protein
MPKFVKMGLGGTGFRGKPGSHDRAARKRAQRRKVLEGFPITRAFESIDEVKEYLSGDKIICLLCGKAYKSLGVHLLRIHDVAVDEYRERYKIPWTYGVLSKKSHEAYSKTMTRRIAEGFDPSMPAGVFVSVIKNSTIRKCPYKAEVARQNVSEYNESRPKAEPRKNRATFGSPEHLKKLRRSALERGFGDHWRGKKQSDEHKAKRRAAHEAYLVRTGKKKPPHVHIENLPCRMCSKDVPQPAAGRKLYCSTRCRSQYYEKKKHAQEATCALCGHPFMATGSQARRISRGLPVYCSFPCRQSANGKRKSKKKAR